MIPRGAACLLLAAALLAVAVGSGSADEAGWRDKIRRAETLLNRAKEHHAAGNRAEAAPLGTLAGRLLAQAEEDKPGDRRTPLLMVYALVYAGDRDGAHRALGAYRARTPRGEEDPEFLYGSALIAFHLDGRPDLAVLALETMRQGAPHATHLEARMLYYLALMGEAAHWRDRADCEHALPLLHKAVDVAVHMGDARRARLAWSRAGVVLSFCRRFRESEAIYRRLLAEEPDNPLWHFNVALLVATQARPEEAIPHYERTLALLEQRPVERALRAKFREAWLKLGNCHRLLAGRPAAPEEQKGHVRAAREALARYMELVPRDARGPFWLGLLLYDQLDRPHEALVQFQKARELDPVCDAALRRMIQIAHRHGPEPTGDAARDAEAQGAWAERLRAWEEDFEQHQAERERIRKLRRAQSPGGSDGCL